MADTLPLDTILHGDCLAVLRTLPDASVDAIVTDPPYFRVKGEAWDRQWDSASAFLAWMGTLADEWRRVLKPNGSLYCFASPQMAARVEVLLGERFRVLNSIVWRKHDGYGNGIYSRSHKETLRAYFPQTERIIFAEHYGADSMALGESGYAAQCEKAHGMVFEPLRAYLDGERRRAGIEPKACDAACGTKYVAARHYFVRSQWVLPTKPHYLALQRLFNEQGRRPAPAFDAFHTDPRAWRYHAHGGPAEYLRADYEYLRADYEYLRADYEELRADYEELRADYEELRRPFAVTADVPYTDVWDFATVPYRPGKHPCEKPLPLMRHIISASTKPGAVVLDCFAGSGATLVAAQELGRHYLGIEREARYIAQAERRLATSAPLHAAVSAARKPMPLRTLWEVSA